jgi:hypothetical protein
MVRFNRRRLPGRRLQRPGRPKAPEPEPISVPEEKSGASTEFNVDAVQGARVSSSESTVALPSVGRKADPNAETAEAFTVEAELPPRPPKRLEFPCACGTILVATPETYDKHTRCAMCQTVMLLNLVYDPEHRSHEIVPFRVRPDSK